MKDRIQELIDKITDEIAKVDYDHPRVYEIMSALGDALRDLQRAIRIIEAYE